METATQSEHLVRFKAFELDLRTHELYQNGSRLKVRGHPVDVLAILLEHPGELVTRETLRKRLWPDDTFVDFEQILNNSVGRLRDALGDKAESPHFIETLPRLGYRFIAQIDHGTSLAEAHIRADDVPSDQSPKREEVVLALPFHPWRSRILVISGFLIIVSAGLTAYLLHRYHARTPTAIHRIAVLPLVNTSVDPQEEYFADGMTDRLITELAQFSAWEVISRTSVMRYKGSTKTLPQIAHELSADRIIEGTVQRSGSRVRITAQLIDATRDVHMWSGAFERDLTDVLALQSEIAQAVADRTHLILTPQEKARLQSPHRVVPAAYDAFLTGKYLFELRNFKDAADYFEKATYADPNFALAHAYLAEAEGMWISTHEIPTTLRAENAARRAMELDPNLAESRIVLGDRKFFRQWNWAEGEAEFRRAVELDPHSESAARHYGLCLDALRKWDAAIVVYQNALRVDPFSRLLHLDFLSALIHAQRHEEAIVEFRKTVELAPESPEAYYALGYIYQGTKRDADAIAAYIKADSINRNRTEQQRKSLRNAAETGGLHRYWLKRIEILQQESKGIRSRPYALAELYARAGAYDRAFDSLEEAYQQHLPMMAWIYSSAAFAPLRNDPRFQDLLRRMNFPPSTSTVPPADFAAK